MIENNKLAQRLVASFDGLRQSLERFSNDRFNDVPFCGSWTAGQTLQHIVLVAGGFAGLLFGKTKISNRPHDQLVGQINQVLLDLKPKMVAPEFVVPEAKIYDKQDFSEQLNIIEAKVAKAIAELDLSMICLDLEIPKMGNISRLEAINFIISHTIRHTYQLDSIATLVDYKDENLLLTRRVVDAPIEKVFESFANPELLKAWWGPKGFTNTFNVFEFEEGGNWSFIMHGPDGKDYPNEVTFFKIQKPVLISWTRQTLPLFNMVIALDAQGENQTLVNFKMIFKDEKQLAGMRDFLAEKNEENFVKLDAQFASLR